MSRIKVNNSEPINRKYAKLIEFIESNKDWKSILKQAPYNLKTLRDAPFDPSCTMLVYNLFESDLSNPVVQTSRGSIISVKDGKCKVVCAPFCKFFNYGEEFADKIDWSSARALQKIDGILIKAFCYNDKVYFVTNGSMNLNGSVDEMFKAISSEKPLHTYYEMLKFALEPENVKVEIDKEGVVTATGSWADLIPEGYTIEFELVSPSNRVICEYTSTELYLLGGSNDKYNELTVDEIRQLLNISLKSPEEYKFNSVEEIIEYMKSWDGSKQEGMVVVDKDWNRIKVKCDDWMRLKYTKGEHNFCFTVLLKSVIEGTTDDLVGNFTSLKERVDNVSNMYKQLLEDFDFIVEDAKRIKQSYPAPKDFAEYVNTNVEPYFRRVYFSCRYENNDRKELRLMLEKAMVGSFANKVTQELFDNFARKAKQLRGE